MTVVLLITWHQAFFDLYSKGLMQFEMLWQEFKANAYWNVWGTEGYEKSSKSFAVCKPNVTQSGEKRRREYGCGSTTWSWSSVLGKSFYLTWLIVVVEVLEFLVQQKLWVMWGKQWGVLNLRIYRNTKLSYLTLIPRDNRWLFWGVRYWWHNESECSHQLND